MPTIQLYCHVSTTGILQIANRKRLQHDLKAFAGSMVELSIKKKNRRSTQQNRYYFGVVVKEIEIRMKQKQVAQYLNGELIRIFASAKEAATALGKNASNLRKHIRNGCNFYKDLDLRYTTSGGSKVKEYSLTQFKATA